MTRQLISSGSQFEHDIGYSRAVVDGEWVFVSGTTGFDYSTMTISDNLMDQTEQCMRNIQSALRQAGAEFADVVRVTYVLPNAARFPECWPILRKYLGDGAAGGHDDFGRIVRSPHANRDRGHRTQGEPHERRTRGNICTKAAAPADTCAIG